MSTFYLLPPRAIVAERFGEFLRGVLPGTDWSEQDLAESLETLLTSHFDVYVVWREDLPMGQDLMSLLVQGYGAEDGDEVIEVRTAGRAGGWASLRWPILSDFRGVA